MVNYKWVTGFAWKNQVKTSFLKLKLDFQLLGKSVSSNYGSTTLDGMVIYHLNHSYLLHTLMERLRFPLQSGLKTSLGKYFVNIFTKPLHY